MQHTYLYISLPLFCTTTTWNFQKLPSYTRFMEEMLYVVQFMVANSTSHFLTAAIKFSCYSSNEIGLLCFFISGSSSFYVVHANVDIKLSRMKDSASLLLFFTLKVRVAVRFTAETRRYLKCKISPRLTWMDGRTYGWFSQNQNFLDV